MTPTAPTTSSALAPLVDVLLATPLDTLTTTQLQTRARDRHPAGRPAARLAVRRRRTARPPHRRHRHRRAPARPGRSAAGSPTSSTATPSAAGTPAAHRPAAPATCRWSCDAVLDGVLTPAQAAVLTRLVGKIDPDALAESQPNLIAVAATMDPAQLGHWVSHQIATHCEPVFEAEQERAHAKRYLTHRRDDDGSLFGRFRLRRRGQRSVPHRPGTARPPQPGPRHPHRRTTPRRRAGRDGRAGPAARRPRRRRRPATAAVLRPARRLGRRPAAPKPPAPPADRGATTTSRSPSPTPSHAAMPGQGGIRAEQACATAAWTGPQTRARIETLLCDARITRVLLSPLGSGHRLPTPARQRHPRPTPQPRRPRPRLRRPRLHPTPRHVRRPPRPSPRRRRPDHHGQPRPALPTGTTSCGTKASSSSTTSPSPGTPSRPQHHQDPLDDLFPDTG